MENDNKNMQIDRICDNSGDESENSNKNTLCQININQDELILQQQRQIEKEISDSIDLVGIQDSVSSLKDEYSGDDIYQLKVKDLSSKYKYIRRTRPDGNCFFRAFCFAYIERLLKKKTEYKEFINRIRNSHHNLIQLGFPQFTVEDFYDTFMDVINRIDTCTDEQSSLQLLHELFNDSGYSDYMVVYLRLITSGQLQKEETFYQHFIEGERTVADFCHQEVEPMFKESDHIHIIALCAALSVSVRVEYMDRGEGGAVIAHNFPDNSQPNIYLLYRPGHYDILYP